MEISLKAYGKINLGLDVVRRREDGYHEVKMIMQTVDLWDELTFCDVTTDEIVITSDSSELPDVKDNIIYKACRMMKDIYGIDKGVHVTVDKHIPVAAGMAGGSADAAAALKAMNMLFGLNLSDEQLMEHGVKLGTDLPCLYSAIPRLLVLLMCSQSTHDRTVHLYTPRILPDHLPRHSGPDQTFAPRYRSSYRTLSQFV